jgi:hypothetical protein
MVQSVPPLRNIVFPGESRDFRGRRWLDICLRTLHLVGLAGLGGLCAYAIDGDYWNAFSHLTLWSGVGLAGIAIWSNGVWLLQLCGQAVLFKLGLLALIPLQPDYRLHLLLLVVVISGVISHAPSSVRHYSWIYRRRLD